MVDINNNNNNKNNNNSIKKKQKWFLFRIRWMLLFIIIIIITAFVFVLWWYNLIIMTTSLRLHDTTTSRSRMIHPSHPIIPYDTTTTTSTTTSNTNYVLPTEKVFHSTIRNCIPKDDNKNKNNNKKQNHKSKCNLFLPTKIVQQQQQQPLGTTTKTTSFNETKTRMQRIIFITPPSIIANTVYDTIQKNHNRIWDHKKMNHHFQKKKKEENDKDDNKDEEENEKEEEEIEWILSTHVPPYGYGKTHGMTKIIRLVSYPILNQLVDTIDTMIMMDKQNLNPITNKNTIITNNYYQYKNHSITLYDVQCVLQLLIRFHCRLSHVAAHTAIHTIQFTENEKDLSNYYHSSNSSNNIFLRELYSFLKYNPTFHSTESTIDDPVIAILTNDLNDIMFRKMKQHPYKYNQFLSYLQQQQNQAQGGTTLVTIQDILESLDEVIQYELQISHNLTKWPCEPFWSVGDDNHWKKENQQQPQPQTITTAETKTKILLSPLITQLASLLTPDCYNDPYVKCFVLRDLCEAKEMGGKNDTTCQSTTK